MRLARSVAGICVIRDAFDIVPFLCGHYLRVGFARVHFVDDGSSDGTFEYLEALSEMTNRISVERVFNDKNRQPDLYTEGCGALIDSGYSTIVPFDSDEFWNIRAFEVEQRFASNQEIVFTGQWINFVQHRDCNTPRSFGLMRMVHRAPVLLSDEEAVAAVSEGSGAFICLSAKKLGLKARRKVRFQRGQHAILDGPSEIVDTAYDIFHLPFRCRSELSKRALNYEPRAIRTQPSESWQGRVHRDKVIAGQADVLWAANSADKQGCLTVNGKQIALTRDYRLRRCLALASVHVLWQTKGRWRGV